MRSHKSSSTARSGSTPSCANSCGSNARVPWKKWIRLGVTGARPRRAVSAGTMARASSASGSPSTTAAASGRARAKRSDATPKSAASDRTATHTSGHRRTGSASLATVRHGTRVVDSMSVGRQRCNPASRIRGSNLPQRFSSPVPGRLYASSRRSPGARCRGRPAAGDARLDCRGPSTRPHPPAPRRQASHNRGRWRLSPDIRHSTRMARSPTTAYLSGVGLSSPSGVDVGPVGGRACACLALRAGTRAYFGPRPGLVTDPRTARHAAALAPPTLLQHIRPSVLWPLDPGFGRAARQPVPAGPEPPST